MRRQIRNTLIFATASAVAFVVSSCGSKLQEAEALNLEETPVQVVNGVFGVQTRDGVVLQRFEAARMEKFERDTATFDKFPGGIAVFSYTDEGLLESVITADSAEHLTKKKPKDFEKWSAYGHVVMKNVIKHETMETDTIYWDRKTQQIYTDCYVKMYSRDGMMQGYGMRSDDRVRNAILLRPFNSFGYVQQEKSTFEVDSVNFIGPFRKN